MKSKNLLKTSFSDSWLLMLSAFLLIFIFVLFSTENKLVEPVGREYRGLLVPGSLFFGDLFSPSKSDEGKKVKGEAVATYPIPVFMGESGEFSLTAKAIYALDVNSGKPLFSKNPEGPLLPASTTKMATALVALAHYNPDEVLTVPKIDVPGQNMGLKEGEKVSVRNLLYGLLVFSGNDAAEVLAFHYPGGRGNFISAMNALSQSLVLKNTNFKNPTGLDEYLHFSTAEDLVKIASFAIQNPLFSQIVSTSAIDVASEDGRVVHKLVNINRLLGKVPGVSGIKTGKTENAGEALVTLIERNGTGVIIVLLGSKDRFGETEKLIDWIYLNYEWK